LRSGFPGQGTLNIGGYKGFVGVERIVVHPKDDRIFKGPEMIRVFCKDLEKKPTHFEESDINMILKSGLSRGKAQLRSILSTSFYGNGGMQGMWSAGIPKR
jgi:hypothetical protein